MGKWERSANSDGVEWHAPVISPFLQSITTKQGNFLLGGLSPVWVDQRRAARGHVQGIAWPGKRRFLFARNYRPTGRSLVLYRPNLQGHSASRAITSGSSVRCVAESHRAPTWQLNDFSHENWANHAGPVGRSTLGFTAFEMHILADWLESEEFPRRPHSVVAKLRPPPPVSNGAPGRK